MWSGRLLAPCVSLTRHLHNRGRLGGTTTAEALSFHTVSSRPRGGVLGRKTDFPIEPGLCPAFRKSGNIFGHLASGDTVPITQSNVEPVSDLFLRNLGIFQKTAGAFQQIVRLPGRFGKPETAGYCQITLETRDILVILRFEYRDRTGWLGRQSHSNPSPTQFPANREFYREFYRFWLSSEILAPSQRTNSIACTQIPCKSEQGIFPEEQGISFKEQGI